MDFESVSQAELQNLARRGRTVQRAPEWPLREDRQRLYEAARNRRTKVEFGNGRVFSLRYARRSTELSYGNYDAVFISLANGSIGPCGWFRIDSLLEDE